MAVMYVGSKFEISPSTYHRKRHKNSGNFYDAPSVAAAALWRFLLTLSGKEQKFL